MKHTTAGTSQGQCSYLHALCQQSFPGPLVGGNVGGKEVNKWIDERISHCKLTDSDHVKEEALKLLLSLLKIACQHYGKLRSLGTDSGTRVIHFDLNSQYIPFIGHTPFIFLGNLFISYCNG